MCICTLKTLGRLIGQVDNTHTKKEHQICLSLFQTCPIGVGWVFEITYLIDITLSDDDVKLSRLI